jgi:hypothetical protein
MVRAEKKGATIGPTHGSLGRKQNLGDIVGAMSAFLKR